MGMAGSAKSKKVSSPKRWSQDVTAHSDALDLEAGVFALDRPAAIARSLKRSADRSQRRKGSPFQSAMSMLNFYINRAGKTLTESRKRLLNQAKTELRRLYGREIAPDGRGRRMPAGSKGKSERAGSHSGFRT